MWCWLSSTPMAPRALSSSLAQVPGICSTADIGATLADLQLPFCKGASDGPSLRQTTHTCGRLSFRICRCLVGVPGPGRGGGEIPEGQVAAAGAGKRAAAAVHPPCRHDFVTGATAVAVLMNWSNTPTAPALSCFSPGRTHWLLLRQRKCCCCAAGSADPSQCRISGGIDTSAFLRGSASHGMPLPSHSMPRPACPTHAVDCSCMCNFTPDCQAAHNICQLLYCSYHVASALTQVSWTCSAWHWWGTLLAALPSVPPPPKTLQSVQPSLSTPGGGHPPRELGSFSG